MVLSPVFKHKMNLKLKLSGFISSHVIIGKLGTYRRLVNANELIGTTITFLMS